ncbi:MAG: C69 family dipeptidase [Saprospiraceae bacterium]
MVDGNSERKALGSSESPDDNVAVISNCYTIGEIDLRDTLNYLGSPDVIDYAIKRGWYNPEKDGDFNFKYAYAAENSIDSKGNKPRQLSAINLISEYRYNLSEDLPFSFKPKVKVTKEKLMKVIADHFEHDENTIFEPDVNPHFQEVPIVCSSGNQYGFVAQLRNYLPEEIANVLWVSVKRRLVVNHFSPYILA